MRWVASVLLMAVSSVASLAQDSEQRNCIERAHTQTEMHVCASEETARIDAVLNDVYSKLLSNAAKQPRGVAKITTAQRAWIAYRDAYIEAMYPANNKQAAYGSSFPMDVNILRAKLARQQIKALKDLLRQYSGAQR